jgi:hypothetical protein
MPRRVKLPGKVGVRLTRSTSQVHNGLSDRLRGQSQDYPWQDKGCPTQLRNGLWTYGLNGTDLELGHVQALWAWWWILHDIRAMSWPGEQLSYCQWRDCSLLQLTRQLILEDLRVVKTLCVPCFPPHYDIVNKFVHMYHTALSHHVSRMHLLVWFSSLIPTLLFITHYSLMQWTHVPALSNMAQLVMPGGLLVLISAQMPTLPNEDIHIFLLSPRQMPK